MRGQRPALAAVLAVMVLLGLLLAGLPVLEQAHPGSAERVMQMSMDDRTGGDDDTALRRQGPAKPRRAAAGQSTAPPEPAPLLPVALDWLMATRSEPPPRIVPTVHAAPALPLPAAPGLRVQRGQAPPLA